MRLAMDQTPKSPKYIRYLGGVGSGKTMIGCITVLSWAVMYPGDYLIGRQFFPELRDTTLKAFLDICPKELIVEHRVADAIVRIKSAGGKVSNILFRAMEDPDKHRSLNLNGFYLDESSQMTEAAFWLLTTRLRGKYIRKGILTTNSDGRSWGWRLFVQKGFSEDPEAKAMFHNIKAPSTENVHLPADYIDSMLKTYSDERRRREIEADEDAFEGAVYPEFRQDTHVVQPFRIPDDWTRVVGADAGFTNPACWLWGAVDFDGNIYLYREYYEKEKLIEDVCKDVVKLNAGDKLEGVYIDPSVRAVRSQTGNSDWDTYLDHLPRNIALYPAKNEVHTGIDRVKMYMKVNEVTNRPKLYIFNTCKNLLNELGEYKWEPLSSGQAERKNEKEAPRKYKDHACDAMRYLIMSRPELPSRSDQTKKIRELPTLEGSVQRELHAKRNPGPKDPLADF